MSKEKFYLLSCGKWLNKRGFLEYFEGKVLYTIRKHRMLEGTITVKGDGKSKVLSHLLKNAQLRTDGKSKMIASADSTDDIAVRVFEIMMKRDYHELKTLLPKFKKGNQMIIRPFYFMLDKEIELYAGLKKIRIKKAKDDDIKKWLDDYEKKHLELKNSIVSSLLKIESA